MAGKYVSGSPSRGRARALSALALCVGTTTALAAPEASDLHGTWRCAGGTDAVSFESEWSLEPSGEYSDGSRVSSRADGDGDGTLENVELDSVERGKWSLEPDGQLRFHVHEVEILGMVVDGQSVPDQQAQSSTEQMRAAAVGRVILVPVEDFGAEGFVTRVSGIETRCRR